MRSVLEAAVRQGVQVPILGALGYGAFQKPPKHIASLWKKVIEEEFTGCFAAVVFAVIDDHNAKGVGNFKPFAEILGTGPKSTVIND